MAKMCNAFSLFYIMFKNILWWSDLFCVSIPMKHRTDQSANAVEEASEVSTFVWIRV